MNFDVHDIVKVLRNGEFWMWAKVARVSATEVFLRQGLVSIFDRHDLAAIQH